MKFYAASSFKNVPAVRELSEKLESRGYRQTYDWTHVEDASTIGQLRAIGLSEKKAVLEADFLIVLLPAGKGSHVELGIALGQGKRIYLYSPQELDLGATATFYHLPEVVTCHGSLEELVARIVSVEER